MCLKIKVGWKVELMHLLLQMGKVQFLHPIQASLFFLIAPSGLMKCCIFFQADSVMDVDNIYI